MIKSFPYFNVDLSDDIEFTPEGMIAVRHIVEYLLDEYESKEYLAEYMAELCGTNDVGYWGVQEHPIITMAGLLVLLYNANVLSNDKAKIRKALAEALVKADIAKYKKTETKR
ncbi:MAG: hypothetical protein IJV92_08620 [Phascolarctobacterium sp.]|nr:hypothetical protein [Phascolarctobacterium sp.]